MCSFQFDEENVFLIVVNYEIVTPLSTCNITAVDFHLAHKVLTIVYEAVFTSVLFGDDYFI